MENFLESLGLDKYTITFQAEEVCLFPYFPMFLTFSPLFLIHSFFCPLMLLKVDMAALTHMTDDDLKAMGIPMVCMKIFAHVAFTFLKSECT